MKWILVVLVCLSGCTEKIVYRDRYKEVPVLVFNDPPKAEPVSSVVLPIEQLKEDAPDGTIAEAYHRSILLLKSENEQLRAAKEPFDDK